MAKDYKIGITIGLLVVILGAAYFLIKENPEPQQEPPVDNGGEDNEEVVFQNDTDTDSGMQALESLMQALGSLDGSGESDSASLDDGTAPVDFGNRPRGEDTDSAGGDDDDAASMADWDLDGEGADDDEEDDGTAAVDLASFTRDGEDDEEGGAESTSSSSASRGGTYFALDAGAERVYQEDIPDIEPPDRPVVSDPQEAVRVEPSGRRIYTVKADDNGFWDVAEQAYGEKYGKYWERIRDANPSANTRALREGQQLVIPDLPASAAPPAVDDGDEEDYGQVTTNPLTGARTYTVSKDDTTGLWGIAKKVYDKGHLWERIQRANPGVRPTALRPGMKLLIPELEPNEEASPARSSSTASTTSPRRGESTTGATTARHGETYTRGGRKYYVVKEDDSYWKIAEQQYGDGTKWKMLEEANPELDRDTIRPGDRVLLPPDPGREDSVRIEPLEGGDF